MTGTADPGPPAGGPAPGLPQPPARTAPDTR